MIVKLNSEVLEELQGFLDQLRSEDFSEVSSVLRTSSIGQHVRHILEMYECLISQYASGIVCYEHRNRDNVLETDLDQAISKIKNIRSSIQLADKEIYLKLTLESGKDTVQSSYFRELWYNLEHCIHHQALIKVACNQLDYISLPVGFGVARSTIDYVKSLESRAN